MKRIGLPVLHHFASNSAMTTYFKRPWTPLQLHYWKRKRKRKRVSLLLPPNNHINKVISTTTHKASKSLSLSRHERRDNFLGTKIRPTSFFDSNPVEISLLSNSRNEIYVVIFEYISGSEKSL
ncbi:hypothetical protein CMV_007660 [Castanea mollissima]|uniref:Uncharacterized protein n=1 Tax=Castanea mollissima TaxID=60419 RepID=A0A8J4RT48_9ROSI|nr:hypothetical protein CMV_007660 [Castanea mollissima]